MILIFSNVTNFWYVIKESFGGLVELDYYTRREIRKSLNIQQLLIHNFKC